MFPPWCLLVFSQPSTQKGFLHSWIMCLLCSQFPSAFHSLRGLATSLLLCPQLSDFICYHFLFPYSDHSHCSLCHSLTTPSIVLFGHLLTSPPRTHPPTEHCGSLPHRFLLKYDCVKRNLPNHLNLSPVVPDHQLDGINRQKFILKQIRRPHI